MKKILMSTAAIAGLAFVAAAPARADEPALQLGLGGYIAGYAVYNNQDSNDSGAVAGDHLKKFNLIKDTEIHLNGEVALDNGITAGAHMELLADRADGGNTVEESYMYLSSAWGRVNVGEEDGIGYLLQVGAPSADDKIDGIRPDLSTFAASNGTSLAFDYAQDDFGYSDKITYITPVFNGFQAGVSFTPTINAYSPLGANGFAGAGDGDLGSFGAVFDDNNGQFDNGTEVAARYEGSFNALDVALGAGYAWANSERNGAAIAPFANVGSDDLKTWNVGANIGWGAFGLGAAYIDSNNGIQGSADTKVWTAGADYTTGPYKLGVSYLNGKTDQGAFTGGADDQNVDRWTGGVVYEWGPGMTFRGAVQWQSVDNVGGSAASAADVDGTQVTLGTQLEF